MDENGAWETVLENAYDIIVTGEINGADTLEFKLPYSDPKRIMLDNEKQVQIAEDVYRIRTMTDEKGSDGNSILTTVYAEAAFYAFIGKLANGTVATYQTLPWNHRGWHGGSGSKGSVNDTHISFEICEDGLIDATYLNAVYKEAAELCAYLCKEYKLDPMADGVIIGHYEGHKRGIASNHADPGHWFPKHGKSMDTFRAEVKNLLSVTEASTSTEPKKLYRVQVGAYSVKANADAMLKKVKEAGFKDAFIKYS